MSKRKQTQNLHLYTYDNARGLPTFLRDMSDNCEVIDAEHVRVQGEINSLDERLTTAEDTIQSLSPESILDYKVRLDALEKKSNAQASLIKAISDGQLVQDRLINKNQADINDLRANIDNNTSKINQLRDDVDANRIDIQNANLKIVNLENRVATLEHEVVDLTNDIIGLGENITDIATQLEAIALLVANKQDKLTAGAGIEIDENNVIKVKGVVHGTYDPLTETITIY